MRKSVSLIPIVLVIYVVSEASSYIKNVGWGPIGLIVGIIVLLVIAQGISEANAKKRRQEKIEKLKETRRELLLAKYGDRAIVNLIESGAVWSGQTLGQLSDSLGPPDAQELKVMKTVIRKIYKYQRVGANKYMLKVTLDDDVVATWTDRRC